MSDVKQPRVRDWALGAYVGGIAFTHDGETMAVATGAGDVHLMPVTGEAPAVVAKAAAEKAADAPVGT